MLKKLIFATIVLSCGSNSNNLDTKKAEKVERLEALDEQKKLSYLADLIIDNENPKERLENFELSIKGVAFINDHLKSSTNEIVQGRTLLTLAIELEKLEFVQILLAQPNIDFEKRSECGKTPLEYAIEKENLNIIEELLKNEKLFVDSNYFNYYGKGEMNSLLKKAFDEKLKLSKKLCKLILEDNINIDKINELLKKGANLNYSKGEYNILLENHLKLLKDKKKRDIIFNIVGIEKKIVQKALLLDLKGKSYKGQEIFSIDKELLKFLLEDLKIDLYFENVKEKNNLYQEIVSRRVDTLYKTNLVSEIYKNIILDKEALDYLLSAPQLDIGKTIIVRPTVELDNKTSEENLLIDLIKSKEKVDMSSVLLALNHPTLNNSNMDINRLVPKEDLANFLGNNVLYRDQDENSSLKLLEFFFKKGLDEKYLKRGAHSIERSFLEVIETGKNRLEKARKLVVKYYPNIKFKQ